MDVRKFYQATNPGKTLFTQKNGEEDRKYYIDFSSVRGGSTIKDLREKIAFWSPDEATCQLFTGHIGCGKSTELRRLKAELEDEGFHVVYLESEKNLEMGDVDVGDILLSVAQEVSESVDKFSLEEPKRLKNILQGAAKLLQTEIVISAEGNVFGGKFSGSTEGDFSGEYGLPGIGELSFSKDEGLSFVAAGIGKITAKTKASPELRSKLRGYLEPRTNGIIEAINTELLEPAIAKLKRHGKKGLVVIVDNLEKVDRSPKSWGITQPEYLFVDRGEQLRGLNCHLVYTMPLALRFSNNYATLMQRFNLAPIVLPMVPVRDKEGNENPEAMMLLRQMVLARAFPDLDEQERLEKIGEIFDSAETLDRLCLVSGGHVRNVLQILNDAIKRESGLPISRNVLEEVIRAYRNEQLLAVTDEEWALLRRVAQRQQKVGGDEGYQTLIHSMFVYEYRDKGEYWFDLNPILAEAKELKE